MTKFSSLGKFPTESYFICKRRTIYLFFRRVGSASQQSHQIPEIQRAETQSQWPCPDWTWVCTVCTEHGDPFLFYTFSVFLFLLVERMKVFHSDKIHTVNCYSFQRVKGQMPQGQTTSQVQINRNTTSFMVNDVSVANTLRSPSFHSQQEGKLGTLKTSKTEQRSVWVPYFLSGFFFFFIFPVHDKSSFEANPNLNLEHLSTVSVLACTPPWARQIWPWSRLWPSWPTKRRVASTVEPASSNTPPSKSTRPRRRLDPKISIQLQCAKLSVNKCHLHVDLVS